MERKPESPAHPRIAETKLSETPLARKATSTDAYLQGNTNARRKAVIEDIGETIPEVSVKYFLEALVPQLRRGLSVDKTIKKLKSKGAITPDGHWALFSVSPGKAEPVEDVYFQPLVDVAKSIVSQSGGNANSQLLTLVQRPREKPMAYVRSSETKPDGCFVLKSKTPDAARLRWQDMALCAEYKKQDRLKDRDDNVAKVLWSMHQCMREDARHRFVYGMTIENETMRLWFSSRADTFVSKEINWRTDHETVVHFFLAMMYANEAEVGWDPTIAYVLQDGEFVPGEDGAPQLEILVQDESRKPDVWYRTHRVLADHGAHGGPGRGTRVWEAYELTGQHGEKRGNPVALKDSWIDHNRPKEGQTMEDIHTSVKQSNPKDYKRLQKSLLTVLRHGAVSVQIGRRWEVDHTRDLMRREFDVPPDHGSFKLRELYEDGINSENIKSMESSFPSNAGTGHHRSHAPQQRPSTPAPRLHHPRVHYRIVFKEVCVRICDLTSLEDIFRVLIHALIVLTIIHGAGWIHRDISSGNVLAERLPDGTIVGKVTDFEYAMRFGDTQSERHEMRTGTEDFMAVEVECMKYLYFDNQPAVAPNNASTYSLDELEDAAFQSQAPADAKPDQPGPKRPAFRYNPLHDVESLWWLSTYFVFNKVVVLVNGLKPSMDAELKGSYNMQLFYASQLFWTQRGREWAITKPGEFSEEVIHLHAVARPAGYLLDKMRRLLHDQYKLIEETLAPITQTVASNVSKGMVLELGRIMASVRGLTIGEFKDDPRRGHFANKTANTALRPDQISHPMTKTEGKQAMIEEASNIDESDDDSLELEPIMPLFLGEQTTRDASPSPRPSSTSQLWDLKVEMESIMPPFFGEEVTRDASPSPGPSSVPQPSGLKGRTTSKLKSMLKLKPKPKGK
ncbi:hypothetical protein POSPLADRAFT_1061146 [Postia placenta MAD-698-R-SB12]|uniref:Fungal-type protein kinase domain-containing protein n=1 Tax=Postia placenta MAD-698-R-SB12 TaxID=670580 RepID=A0A1X6MPI3_9APHY|nr:hypothetical protein POSPLADRAFT_1061146 [Postia placenta MAD-698-R-SB12]OSX58053.1 hypothetical protein POSPLADRAFT_1061146 [Postia placenta MAD-698-R-SB12]